MTDPFLIWAFSKVRIRDPTKFLQSGVIGGFGGDEMKRKGTRRNASQCPIEVREEGVGFRLGGDEPECRLGAEGFDLFTRLEPEFAQGIHEALRAAYETNHSC